MRFNLCVGLALALTACQPIAPTMMPAAPLARQVLHSEGEAHEHEPARDYTPARPGEVWELPLTGPQGEKLRPMRATATSHHGCLVADRAIDGDMATNWANADLSEGEAALTLEFPSASKFRGIRIKTDPTAHGVTFKVMTSSDGVRWNPSSGRLVNLTWGMEPQEVAGVGRFLKLELYNHMLKPTSRFQVYELEVYGGGTGVGLPWMGQ